MDLLQRSNIEIHKVCYGELLALEKKEHFWFSLRKDLSPAGSPYADTSVVWVAMLSTSSENWSKFCVM